MLGRPQRVLVGLAIGMAVQTTFVLLTSVIASGCGLHLSLRVWLIAWPLAKLASLLPVTQGGIGVREAALAALAAPFGAPPAMTVAVGLVWETIIIVGGLVAGIIAYGLGARRGTRHSWTSICHEKSR
jgi:glycosyltransferase 2 family protein